MYKIELLVILYFFILLNDVIKFIFMKWDKFIRCRNKFFVGKFSIVDNLFFKIWIVEEFFFLGIIVKIFFVFVIVLI